MIDEAELKERANAALAGKSKNYVDDVTYFARAIEELLGERASLNLENKTLNDNVTALQIAGTALVRENRRLKGIEDT